MLITACCPVPPCGGPIYEAGVCVNIEHADDIYIHIQVDYAVIPGQ